MKTIREYLRESKNVGQIQDKLDEIMDNFDFDRVHRAMKALNWTWYTGVDRDCAVPEICELRKAARGLLKDTIWRAPEGETRWCIETGGFKAECIVWDTDEADQNKPGWEDDVKHQVNLSLSFILEDWSSYEE